MLRGIVVYDVVRKQFATGNVLFMQMFVDGMLVYESVCLRKCWFMKVFVCESVC